MFSKPLDQIQYSDVENFCKTFAEGVRIEYKSDMPKSIPKAVSAFANTLGGIIIIGVETEKVNNRVTNILGIDKEIGIEEKITNSALTGIYPGVIPEVKIFDIPTQQNKIIVVIRIHESIEAPHAIENSTKVYIRTGNVSSPEDLIEVDRIEYLFKRRNKQEQLREQIKQEARDRVDRLLNVAVVSNPFLDISVSPFFPYQPLVTLGNLYSLIEQIPQDLLPVHNSERTINGLCKFYGNPTNFTYIEINHYGLMFNRRALHKIPTKWTTLGVKEEDKIKFIYFGHIVIHIAKVLKFANSFYEKVGYGGNLEVEVRLHKIANEYLMYADNGFPDDEGCKALDDSSYSKDIVLPGNLESDFTKTIISLTRNILWIFNMPPNINSGSRVTQILQDAKLL